MHRNTYSIAKESELTKTGVTVACFKEESEIPSLPLSSEPFLDFRIFRIFIAGVYFHQPFPKSGQHGRAGLPSTLFTTVCKRESCTFETQEKELLSFFASKGER